MSGKKFVDGLAALTESSEPAPDENATDDLHDPDIYGTTDVATDVEESPEAEKPPENIEPEIDFAVDQIKESRAGE